MNKKTSLTKILAMFMIVLLSLSPAAYAGFLPEFNDPVHVADDVDESGNDAEDLGSFDFSAFSSIEETSAPSLSTSSISASGEVPVYAVPKPQAPSPGYLKYDEAFSTSLFSGAASYAYPIGVPPGVQGFEPSLSLFYNHHASRAVPSAVGTGWNLNINYVYRNTNNTRSDISDDEFILNLNGLHEKLVYVPSEKRYHTQHESYLFIKELRGDENEKGVYWIVKSKDGTEYRFGYRKDSELVSNLENYVSVWSLDEVRDVNGNSVTYNYSENHDSDKGVVYLDDVSYGLSSIKFVYNHSIYASPDLYVGGREVKQSGIVEEIVVTKNNSLVRKYLLEYQMMEGKPFLASITEVGSDGISELPSVEFAYNRFDSAFQESSAWQLPADSYFGTDKDEGVRLLDVNGDGLVDIVKAKESNHQVRYNTGSGFSSFQTLSNFIPGGFVDGEGNDAGVRFLDYDGNAKVDIVQSISGAVQSKVLKTNTGTSLNDVSYSLPSGISFVEKTREGSCKPPYLQDYECEESFSCDGSKCKRTCIKFTCSDSGSEVLNYVGDPRWNDDDYQEEDTGTTFYPSAGKCYKFEYTGSADKDSDDSECYDLYTDDDYDSGDYDEDCDGKDLDAYAGIGFEGGGANSWLRTITGGGDYGFIGDVENSYWSYRYVSNYDKDASPDASGSNKGDWDGFNREICDEAGTFTIYCAPTHGACASWGKERCGYGCAFAGIRPFVVMGIYKSNNDNLWDALDDYEPECSDMVDDNDYYGDGTYKVTEYMANKDYQYPECTMPFRLKDNGIRLADVNADGKTDIIQGTDTALKTWPNKGNKFVLSEDWTLPSEAYFTDSNGKDKGVRLGDVNGDGLIDLVKGESSVRKTWLNTGRGWMEKSGWAIPAEAVFVNNGENQGVQLVDINLDGLDDLVKAKDGSASVWVNTGRGWAQKGWNLPSGVSLNDLSYQVADINGDGTLDVVKASGSEQKTWVGTGTAPYTLMKVKNGLGGEISIAYRGLNSIDNTGADEISDLGFSGYVVSSVTYGDGMGNVATYAYDYEGGLFDAESGEFRGFGKVIVYGPDNSSSEHYFSQNSEMKGLEYLSQVFNQSSKLRMQVNSTYSPESKNGYYTVLLSGIEESIYGDYDTAPQVIKTEFSYDAYGNPTKISYFGDTSRSDNKFLQFSYIYNESMWLIDKPKQTTLLAGDGVTKMKETNYSYDNQPYGEGLSIGLMTREELWHSAGNNPVYSYSYDSYGNLVKMTDPNGSITSYGYDSEHVFINSTINALGHETQFQYDAGTGNLKSEKDPNGYTTSYEYDLFGRQIKKILPYDSATYPTVEVSYHFNGKAPGKSLSRKREQSLKEETYDTYYFYDGFGRLIQTKSEADDNQQVAENTRYDGNGRVAYQSNPHFVAFDADYSVPAKSSPGILYAYDALNRATKITNPDNTSKKIVFDKALASVYDENGHRKDYLSDGFGRIIKVSEYAGNEAYNTIYQYDMADNLLRIIDSRNNSINYSYDTLGRRTGTVDLNIGRWNYTFDPSSNLISQTNGNRQRITMEYDSLGRLVKKSSSSGNISYAYDADKKGTLSKIAIPIGTIAFKYDDRLRIAEKLETYDGLAFSTSYEYDSFDRVMRATHPDGSTTSYSYNKQGLASEIGGVLNLVDYNAAGLPSKKAYSNNIVSEHSYNPANFRLAKIKTEAYQELEYDYDANGNTREIRDLQAAEKYSMDYDELDRLVGADKRKINSLTPDYAFVYDYDSIGNIIKIVRDSKKAYAYEYGERPIHSPSAINYDGPVPILKPIGDKTIEEKSKLAFTVSAEYDGTDGLSYGASELPQGAGFDSSAARFEWTPARGQSGAYAITFIVSDGFSSDSEKATITVQGVNHAPVIESFTPDSNNLVVDEGRSMRFEVVASDPDSDKVFYRWTLDGKVVFYMSYYVYSPNYSDAGEHVISVSVDDGHLSDSRETHVIVQDAVCVSSETRPCDLQSGVCSESVETCSNGEWHGCGAAEYGGSYETHEKSCDSKDNDCDGAIDENVFGQRSCGNEGAELLTCADGKWVPISECYEGCGDLGQPCCGGNLCMVTYFCNYAANKCEISGYWDPWL